MIAALVFASLAAVAPSASIPRFEPRPCAKPAPSPTALCGFVRVSEDRANPGKRSIDLNLIVLPAAAGTARLPALFDIDGGPGLAGTKNAGFYATNAVSKGRDVVLLDQRGTGRSGPLTCPALEAIGPNQPMLPRSAVDQCRKALSARADLRFYGTLDAVADLDDVRRALGYDRIDLFALSYGTTVALRYMRHYPDRVRAAVLMGTSPPGAMPPQHHATAGARALDLLIADCATDPACSERFPDLKGNLAQAEKWLDGGKGPISTEIFMERLRAMLYSPQGRTAVPLAIERAAAGGVEELLAIRGASGPPVADGMFLAVTCGEGLALMDYARAVTEARMTAMGDYRLRRQRDACAHWPRVRVARDHVALPVSAKAAVLLISGEWDPVTPPDWADQVHQTLPRSSHIVIPAGAHIPDGMSGLETCLDPLMIAFLDHGDPKALDISCVDTMKAPAYRLN